MADRFGYFEFADRVRFENRFLLDKQSRCSLRKLAHEAKARTTTFARQEVFWRAQINQLDDYKVVSPDADPMPVPLSAERMLPRAEFVGDGRLNPRGIAYLYLASSRDTAIAEVRPPKAAHVTVADVTLVRAVRVVDCRAQRATAPVWADLDLALSFPVNSTEPWRTYLPTQALAEFFRTAGYDGIVCRSSLSEKGYNLTLFDATSGRIGTRRLYTIEAVEYTYLPDALFPEAY